MTLHLILTRHAKSGWDDDTLDDHSRPLSKRGIGEAIAIGKWMEKHGYLPDLVLCSSALRTRETWALIADQLSARPRLLIERALYLAPPEIMLQIVRRDKGPRAKMVLGHNPGSAFFASAMAKAAPKNPKFHHYPPAATTVFELPNDDWADVEWGSGVVVDFAAPSELPPA